VADDPKAVEELAQTARDSELAELQPKHPKRKSFLVSRLGVPTRFGKQL
jgi:hypothetical protein